MEDSKVVAWSCHFECAGFPANQFSKCAMVNIVSNASFDFENIVVPSRRAAFKIQVRKHQSTRSNRRVEARNPCVLHLRVLAERPNINVLILKWNGPSAVDRLAVEHQLIPVELDIELPNHLLVV